MGSVEEGARCLACFLPLLLSRPVLYVLSSEDNFRLVAINPPPPPRECLSAGPTNRELITMSGGGAGGCCGGAMRRLVLHGALVATAVAWAPAVPRPSTAIHASRCAWASGGALAPPRAVRMMAAGAATGGSGVEPSRRGSLRRLMRLLSRSCLIWSCAAKQLIKVAIVKRRYKRSPVTDPKLIAARRQLAVDLRDTLILLGPTFIKVGQLLSTRIDVLPVEVIQELARLQNDVPGFPAKRARAIIAEELGAPVEELFRDFTDTPLAAASLAQVHRATLKDGREVVVKVRARDTDPNQRDTSEILAELY